MIGPQAIFSAIRHVIHNIDVGVYTYFNSIAGDWLLDRVVREEEGNQLLKGGIFLTLYWHAWFRCGPRQNERRKQIATIVVATLGALAIARILAVLLPFRVRPMFESGLPHAAFTVPIHPNMENWSAFPSDMATYFIGLAFGMAYLSRSVGIPLLFFAAIWVCVPRMYLGLHYLSDIVAGAALAILTVWLALRSKWVQESVALAAMRFAENRPATFYAMAFLLSLEMANTFDSVRSLGHGFWRAVQSGPHHTVLAIGVIAVMPLLGLAVAAYALASKRRRSHEDTRLAH
jgi:membrane-associated phospholipid phosphatase